MRLKNPLFWFVVRGFIRWRLSRAAKLVLRARLIESTDGSQRRWLEPDIRSYLSSLEPVAKQLRPLASLEVLPTIGNRMMVELAVYTTGAYRALLDSGLSRRAARSAVADIGWLVYAWLLRVYSFPFRLLSSDPGTRIRGTIGFLLRFPFSASGAPGYEVKVYRDGDNIITNWTHCPPQSFVRDVISTTSDRGDLDAFYHSWCLYDWPGADLVAGDGRTGHYSRKHTLSRGDSVCDMCWKAQV